MNFKNDVQQHSRGKGLFRRCLQVNFLEHSLIWASMGGTPEHAPSYTLGANSVLDQPPSEGYGNAKIWAARMRSGLHCMPDDQCIRKAAQHSVVMLQICLLMPNSFEVWQQILLKLCHWVSVRF